MINLIKYNWKTWFCQHFRALKFRTNILIIGHFFTSNEDEASLWINSICHYLRHTDSTLGILLGLAQCFHRKHGFAHYAKMSLLSDQLEAKEQAKNKWAIYNKHLHIASFNKIMFLNNNDTKDSMNWLTCLKHPAYGEYNSTSFRLGLLFVSVLPPTTTITSKPLNRLIMLREMLCLVSFVIVQCYRNFDPSKVHFLFID